MAENQWRNKLVDYFLLIIYYLLLMGERSINILGIESSCDETAAAIVADGRIVKSSVVASQSQLHQKYGGVVP